MNCIGNGVGSNYNNDSGVGDSDDGNGGSGIGDSDDGNGGSGNSKGGGHIQQSLNAATEETAAALMVMATAMAMSQQPAKSILGWVAGQVSEWVAGWDTGRVAGRITGGV